MKLTITFALLFLVSAFAVSAQVDSAEGTKWQYLNGKSGIDDIEYWWAGIMSTNSMDLKFPYDGDNRMQLEIYRNVKKFSYIRVSAERGTVQCSRECPVKFKFDDEESFTIYGYTGENNVKMIYLPEYGIKKLLKKMISAKKLKIEFQFYLDGSRVGTFNVEGFNPAKVKAVDLIN